jgi:hypothetical protein
MTTLALVAQTAAAVGIKPKRATFKATVVGTQEGHATLNEPGCDVSTGEVTENIQFKSAPFRVRVSFTPFVSVLSIGDKGAGAPFKASGSITRLNSWSAACEADPETRLDCGTRPISNWKLLLAKNGSTNFQRGDKVKLGIGEQRPSQFFNNCQGPAPPGSLLTLIDENTAKLSLGRLLNRRKKKIVVTGKGTDNERGTTRTLTYKLTLKRR